jgi:hypothetical protein
MSFLRSLWFNLLSFFGGLFVVAGLFFLVNQSGMLTANIWDALHNTQSTTADITLSHTDDRITASLNRSFTLPKNSFRIEFFYDESSNTSGRSLDSSFSHSFSLQDGVWIIVISPDIRWISSWDVLFSLMTPNAHEKDIPIIQSITWYNDIESENLSFSYNINDTHHK